MNGSSGQAVIVNGVVAPQDSAFLQTSQTVKSGAREFHEALNVAAARDEKNHSKQLDRTLFGSAEAAGTSSQSGSITEALSEPDGSTLPFQEGVKVDGEALQALDLGTLNETAPGNGLPASEGQPLPVVAGLAGLGTGTSNAAIHPLEPVTPGSRLPANEGASRLTNVAASNFTNASNISNTGKTGRLGLSDLPASEAPLSKVTSAGLSPSKAEGGLTDARPSDDLTASRLRGALPIMGNGLPRATPGIAALSSLEPATDLDFSPVLSSDGQSTRALDPGTRIQANVTSDPLLAMNNRPQASTDHLSAAQPTNRGAEAPANSLRTPLAITDLDPTRMSRMSLGGTAWAQGSVAERASQMGLNRSENLRGQLERVRFSQSMDSEGGRKGVDLVPRLARVEALVSELSLQPASKQVMVQGLRSPSLLQSSHSLANQEPSLAVASTGGVSGQLSPKHLMSLTPNAIGIVNAKIDSAAWMDQIANHAKMAIKQDLRSVEIKLTPAHLGTIEILVAQDDESTQLAFFTKHAHVRDALESQLARLQKCFQEDGLELSDAWVSDQSLAEHRERQSAAEQGDDRAGDMQGDSKSGAELVGATVDHRQKLDSDRQLDVWA